MATFSEWIAEKERIENIRQQTFTHECEECGAGLVTPHDPKTRRPELRCSRDKSHQGYRKKLTKRERWFRGDSFPIYEAEWCERMFGPRGKDGESYKLL